MPPANDSEGVKFFRLENDEYILFWLGVQHSCDISHPQFDGIEKKWGEFLKLAKSPLAVVEGHPVDIADKNRNDAITRGGEVGLMEYLTRRDGIPIKCFEPYRDLEMNYVAGLFGKEKTEYYYFGRAVAQWHRIVKVGDLEEYLMPFLERDKKAAKWPDFDFTVVHMRQIHKSLFGGKMDLNDRDFYLAIESPSNPGNPLRDVVEASGEYRDKAVIESAKVAWEDHDIFMVYGRDHQEAHEKELKEFCKIA